MAILQVKGIDDDLYAELKAAAESENRSVSQQVVHLLRLYLARKEQIDRSKAPAQILLNLSAAWNDERTAQAIVKEIRTARKNSRKLKTGFDVSS